MINPSIAIQSKVVGVRANTSDPCINTARVPTSRNPATKDTTVPVDDRTYCRPNLAKIAEDPNPMAASRVRKIARVNLLHRSDDRLK